MNNLKLKKFEKRELMNKIRFHENEIAKIEDKLKLDEDTYIIAKGYKTLEQTSFFNYCNEPTLQNRDLKHIKKLKMEHLRQGDTVICVLEDEEHGVKVMGVARLAKGERFRQAFGMSIAENRAMQNFIEQQTQAIIEYL